MIDPVPTCPAHKHRLGRSFGTSTPTPLQTAVGLLTLVVLGSGWLAPACGLAGDGQSHPPPATSVAIVADQDSSPTAPLLVRERATGSRHAWSPRLVSVVIDAEPAELVEWAAPQAVGQGMMHQFARAGTTPEAVLIHFHGAVPAVKQAFARCELDVVLVILNFPGLSSAYERPFADNPELFDRILSQSRSAAAKSELAREAREGRDTEWQCVYLSSFSAGYGAVRQILKQPKQLERIEGIVAADSIYAGLKQEEPTRQVDDGDMRGFLRFATEASNNRKTFVLSHSSQQTPYASTTETADYLLNSLQLRRSPDTTLSTASLTQTTRAQRGRLIVLGYEGTSGSDHMQHLHQIDTFWESLLDIAP